MQRKHASKRLRHDDVEEWVAVDHIGAVVAGPFETEAAAWTAFDDTSAEGTGFAEPAVWHEKAGPTNHQ